MQYTVNSSSDSGAGSLREAIALANENAGSDKIVIEVDNIELNSKIEIGDSVEIEGNDVIITQTGEEGIFIIDDFDDDNRSSVFFADLTLTGAKSPSEGGAIATWENLTLDGVIIKDNESVTYGGGVYAYGSTLVITNSIFEGNKVAVNPDDFNQGGALYVEGNSDVTIDNSIFRNNDATSGAIYLHTVELNAANIEITQNTGRGIIALNSLINVDNALISDNNGGIALGKTATLFLDSSTISNNQGSTYGGGLALEAEGIATVTNSIIKNNVATNTGGGLSVTIDSFAEVSNSIISGNSAPVGSAIETFDLSKVTITDTYVTGNSGEQFEGDIQFGGSNVDNPFGQEPTDNIGYSSFTVEEPAVEEPAVEEPAVEEPAVEEPAVQEPVVEEPAVEDVPNMEITEVNRFYQSQKGFHFYTADINESNAIQQETAAGNLSYDYEGKSFAALASNTDTLTGEAIEGAEEVHRFFNSDTGAHLFTMFEAEKEYIETTLDNYSYEGVAYYAFESEHDSIDTIPVYRMLNGDTGTHLFTPNSDEVSHIQNNLSNFMLEGDSGVAFYVMEI